MRTNNLQRFTIAVLLAHFALGVLYTHARLAEEFLAYYRETPVVNLLCSYWYELYEPNATFKWIKENVDEPIMPLVVDKTATLVYSQINGVTMIPPEVRDTMYVYTAYRAQLMRQVNTYKYSVKRINPRLQCGNVYMIKRFDK